MRGAVVLALRLGLSSLIIGLTVVAAGTSAPEFITSLTAALGGAPDIAVGNVVGSNIANLLLIAGVAAALRPLASMPRMLWRDGLAMIAATAAFAAIALSGELPRWSGLALLAGLVAYLSWSYRVERRLPADVSVAAHGAAELGRVPSRLVAGGRAELVRARRRNAGRRSVDPGRRRRRPVGGDFRGRHRTDAVRGRHQPAGACHRRRGHDEIALGNVLGSCIFNILAIAGGVVAIQPLPVTSEVRSIDLWVLLAVTLAFPLLLATGRRLGRAEGVLLLVVYGLYVGQRVALPAAHGV